MRDVKFFLTFVMIGLLGGQIAVAESDSRAELETRWAARIQSLLDRMPHATVAQPTWEGWGEDGRSWYSVDSPGDVDDVMSRYREEAES